MDRHTFYTHRYRERERERDRGMGGERDRRFGGETEMKREVPQPGNSFDSCVTCVRAKRIARAPALVRAKSYQQESPRVRSVAPGCPRLSHVPLSIDVAINLSIDLSAYPFYYLYQRTASRTTTAGHRGTGGQATAEHSRDNRDSGRPRDRRRSFCMTWP